MAVKKTVGVIVLIFTPMFIRAQCPSADFHVSSAACVQQNILIENSSSGADNFFWDLCSGDLQNTPSANFVVSGSSFFRARSFRMVQSHTGSWHGFAIDQPNNLLVRFDFGSSPDNTPVVTSLGNPGGKFQNALDFELVYHNNFWYALVANTSGNNLLRLNFGLDLTSLPTVTDLGSFSGALTGPSGITILQDENNLFALISNSSSAQIVKLDFGNSLLNTPAVSVFNVPGGSGLRSLDFIRECDRWFGLVTSYNTGELYYLDFTDGLNQPPAVGKLVLSGASYSFPATIRLVNEGGEFYAFVQSAFPAHVYRLAFGPSIIDRTGTYTNLGNLGISNDNGAFDIAGFNSYWRAFSIDLSGAIPGSGRLFRLVFPENCPASIRTFQGFVPTAFTYGSAGTFRISLRATDAQGRSSYRSKNITVSSATAPDIDFNYQNLCAGHAVNFTSVNHSGNVVAYSWNFGDGNNSSLQHPSHTYAAPGAYTVNLSVTASNGCTNAVAKNLQIIQKPVADFVLPSGPVICTNQEYFFQNTTVFDPAIEPTWTWLINGSTVSNARDLYMVFASPVSQEITLRASIPGCADEKVKTIGTVAEGPLVDFIHAGQCAETVVQFTNQTVGQVSSYMWQFGDSQTSAAENPEHTYLTPGNYAVSLTATNAAGCVNSKTRSVTIYSRPQTDFTVALPPFSCSGSPTQFTDLTPNPSDSNIASWLWNFDEGGSTSTLKNPQHTYAASGTYNVSLTAATNFGCSRTIQKPVFISPSPAVNFSYSPPCRSVPVSFNDLTPGTNVSWLWQIESSFYTVKNPVHTFTTSGNKTVTLTVTGANGCIGSSARTVVVPQVLVPDFLTERTCTNQQTLFTSNTNDAVDPIISYQWNFGAAGNASGNPAVTTFTGTGNFPVSLTVITQTGCAYVRTKNINISAAPSASFNVSADVGGAPLQVQFTNTSAGAHTYLWHFGDPQNTTTTETSPQFTFTEVGTYLVELKALNVLGCEGRAQRTIHVVIPVLDVRLAVLEPLRSGDQLIPAVTLFNRSNVPITYPLVAYELSGRSVIQEIIPVTLPPNTSYRHLSSLRYPVSGQDSYICASVLMDDVEPADNRLCVALEAVLTVIPPFPNPVSRQQNLTVSWTSTVESQARIQLITTMGQEVFTEVVPSHQGYNAVYLPASQLPEGIYLLRMRIGDQTHTFRIQVIHTF